MITATASDAAAADVDHLLINGKSISVESATEQEAATTIGIRCACMPGMHKCLFHSCW